MKKMTLSSLSGFPLVEPDDNLSQLIIHSMEFNDLVFCDGDILVVAQKIVSKAENRYVYLNHVNPTSDAIELASKTDKDPRLADIILSESESVIRACPGVVIVKHRLGYVHANAGIDQSNIKSDNENPRVLLLPIDPDASAAELRADIFKSSGASIAIIINDSSGRAWRNGTVGMAIGCAGFEPLENLIGMPDLFNRTMEVTEVAVADELAAAASFLMGQANEGSPIIHIRGAQLTAAEVGSQSLLREKSKDLFQ